VAMSPVVPGRQPAGAPRAETGPVAALKAVLRELQREVEEAYQRLRGEGTCGPEFMRWLDEIEEKARREMIYRGFEPLGDRVYVPQRSREDLVLGYFRYDSVVIEIGLRGMNRCGRLEEVSGGEPPRVYARIYIGGRASMVLEAGEEAQRAPRSTYYII
jgi:hypothetical protein